MTTIAFLSGLAVGLLLGVALISTWILFFRVERED